MRRLEIDSAQSKKPNNDKNNKNDLYGSLDRLWQERNKISEDDPNDDDSNE